MRSKYEEEEGREERVVEMEKWKKEKGAAEEE